MNLSAPPQRDAVVQERLAEASAERYGRPVTAVERDLQTALDRMEATHRVSPSESQPGRSGAGTSKDTGAKDRGSARTDGTGKHTNASDEARNEHRNKRKPNDPQQQDFIDRLDGRPSEPAPPPTEPDRDPVDENSDSEKGEG